jgi:ribonuclease G
VHPILFAFLTRGFPSIRMKWYFKFKRYIRLQQDKTLSLLEFRFFNKNEEEIKMS